MYDFHVKNNDFSYINVSQAIYSTLKMYEFHMKNNDFCKVESLTRKTLNPANVRFSYEKQRFLQQVESLTRKTLNPEK